MSGLLAQLGFGQEVRTVTATPTAGAGTAGVPNTALITFGTPHGITEGDLITFTGFTPSGYNGQFTVIGVPSTTTIVIDTLTTLLATATVMGTVSACTGWGVTTTPDTFFELGPETIKSQPARLEGQGIAAGSRVDRADRIVNYEKDAAGDIQLEILDKGFGMLFKNLMGGVSTTGPDGDGAYTHVFTIANTRGLGLTTQITKPTADGAIYCDTFPGSKIVTAVFEASVDNLLMLKITLDTKGTIRTFPIAIVSYVAGAHLLSYIGGSVQVDGNDFDAITKATYTMTNNFSVARRFLGSRFKREQIEAKRRTIAVALEAEFNDNTLYNKLLASTPAGAIADLTSSYVGPEPIGGTTYPSITFHTPNLRIDGDTPNVPGPDLLQFKTTGKALDTTGGSGDALTITMVTADATV